MSHHWSSWSYHPSWYHWSPHRYYYQPYDWYWDGCRPHVSILVGRPLVTTYVPVYVNDSYGTIGSVETYTNDYVAASSPVYPVASAAPTYEPASQSRVATTYRATSASGVMDWADTPVRVMSAITAAPESQRAAVAGRFLGRSVAGAWELVFERSQPAGTGTMLLCSARGASSTPSPVIALIVDQAPADLRAGAVLVATGRVAEISINDPEAPNGVLVLEDVKIAL
ncbi:hypothetical protein PHYC_01858 [Phycisphaerales bacterium]|nr:hypothetical protein PHYC_01858 [Phycisphaerales bacterium]